MDYYLTFLVPKIVNLTDMTYSYLEFVGEIWRGKNTHDFKTMKSRVRVRGGRGEKGAKHALPSEAGGKLDYADVATVFLCISLQCRLSPIQHCIPAYHGQLMCRHYVCGDLLFTTNG